MDPRVAVVLADYEIRRAAENDLMATLGPAGISRRDEFLIPVGPEAGTVLNLLIRSLERPRILELGTSYGYSTVYLAEAARAAGGHITTLELSPEKSAFAAREVARAGLAEYVEFKVGDALDWLRELPGPFDFVLVDLWKELYVPCLELVYPKLAKGGFLAGDNMLSPPMSRPEAEAYRARIRQLDLDTVLLPIGSGVELSRRR